MILHKYHDHGGNRVSDFRVSGGPPVFETFQESQKCCACNKTITDKIFPAKPNMPMIVTLMP